MIIHTSIVDALRAMGFVLVISMIYDIVEDSQINTGRRDEGAVSYTHLTLPTSDLV